MNTTASLVIRPQGGSAPGHDDAGSGPISDLASPDRASAESQTDFAASRPTSHPVCLDVITDRRLSSSARLLGGLIVAGMPAQEARQMLGLSRATFYRAMSQLEAAGWVKR